MGLKDFADKAKEAADKAMDVAGDAAGKAMDVAGDAVEKARDVAGSAAETAVGKVDDMTGGKVPDAVKNAVDKIDGEEGDDTSEEE